MPAKITYKKAVEHIASLPGFSMESPEEKYENADSKIIIRHHAGDINHTFETSYRIFWNKKRCFKCGRNNRGKHRAQNRAKEFVKEISPDYTLLGEYTKATTLTLIRHNICGYEWKTTPNNLLTAIHNGEYRCPFCNKKIIVTPEVFYKNMKENNNHEFKSVKFYDTKTPVDVICIKGHHSKMNYQGLMYHNSYCSICNYKHAGEYHRYTKEDIQSRLDNKFGKDEIKIVGDYINFNTPTKFMHISNDCNFYTWEALPSTVLGSISGKGCPKCLGNIRKINTEDFKKLVYKLVGNEYLVLGKYNGAHTPIKIQHNIKKCHHIFSPTPHNFTKPNGTRCPVHKKSHGELWVRKYLITNNYRMEEEKKFPDLQDKYPLRYDFYLNDYNILIEYDGEQHTELKLTGIWEQVDLETLHKHDLMKNEYAKKHNIPLIRIPYTVVGQEAVNNYLDEKLAKYIN